MDTTGTTAGMCFYNMALHNEKLDMLLKEIKEYKNGI